MATSPIATACRKRQRERRRRTPLELVAAAIVALQLPLSTHDGATFLMAHAVDIPIIAVSLPQTVAVVQSEGTLAIGDNAGAYVPLAQALGSVITLAVEHINAHNSSGSRLLLDGYNLSLTFIQESTGSAAVQGVCSALMSTADIATAEENGTFGVSCTNPDTREDRTPLLCNCRR